MDCLVYSWGLEGRKHPLRSRIFGVHSPVRRDGRVHRKVRVEGSRAEVSRRNLQL